MIGAESILGIIPARGGSKRFIRKNLALLAGRPLISYTVNAAKDCRLLDELVVSTDDPEIAAVSRQCGANVPFLRPAELARDESGTFDVIKHAIDYFKGDFKREFDYVMLLQPTSPLRDSADINGAVQLLKERRADAVISVCEVEHSPLWTNTLPADASMAGFLSTGVKNKRSQDLPQYYRLNGALYICRTERLLEERSFFIQDNIYAYKMSQENSVDVDTELDLKLCEVLLTRKLQTSNAEN